MHYITSLHHTYYTCYTYLAPQAWLKLGQWQRAMLDAHWLEARAAAPILQSLQRATELKPASYKAWHAWAMINFEVVAQTDGAQYVVPAVRGFSRSIALGGGRVALQDILRLLTLWFKYGPSPEVDAAVREGVDGIAVDTWLAVIPQIIARIHSPTPLVRRSVHALLDRVAEEHPQGLIYPLTVASKSLSEARRGAALAVLGKIRTRCDTLVEQAPSTYYG